MKKITILSVLILTSVLLYSQAWETLLPQNKKENNTLTLHDYQKAFNTYWEPYNVDRDGYYIKNGEKIKAAGWKQFKRWEWYMESRVNPSTGAFPITDEKAEWEKYISKYPNKSKSLDGNWVNLGIENSTGGYHGIGRLNCIAFHPNDPTKFWVGAPHGGIWATYDGGATWAALNDNEWNIGVSSIAIPDDYVTSPIIYIATGDRETWSYNFGSSGVMKSIDGGQTWIQTELEFHLGDGKFVNKLFIHPGGYIYAATTDGIYISYNEGDGWLKLNSVNLMDVEMLPSNPNIMYGSTKSKSGFTRIYLSTDAGVSWTEIMVKNGIRTELAVSPDAPNKVFAVVANSAGALEGVYTCEYPTTTFTQVFSGQPEYHNLLGKNCAANDNDGQGDYDLALEVNPLDADEVLLGGINTWKSNNGGVSWDIISHWNSTCNGDAEIVHADKHFLAFQPFTNRLYECNDGGLYKSYNSGDTWTDISNGLNIAQAYRLSQSSSTPNELITGLQDCGTKYLSGGSWNDATDGDGTDCLIDYNNNDIQYSTTQNGGIYRTTNHWNSNTKISENLPESDSGAWVTPIKLHPLYPNNLYVGYTNFYHSSNKGDSFTKKSNFNDGKYIIAIAISETSTSTYAISKGDELWRTENAGSTWTNITNNIPVPDGYISSIAFSDQTSNIMWVTLTYYNSSKVFETVNGGSSWQNISSGLPATPMFSVVQNKLATQQELYVATTLGVFVKIGEQDWIPFRNGLPSVPVNEIEIFYSGSNSKVRAATWGRGIWESDLFSFSTADSTNWTGIKSSDWFDADNWKYGIVPNSSTNVIIPDMPPNKPSPVIAGGTASCKSLTIESGGTMEIVNSLDINGNFINYGELIMSGSNADIDIAGNVIFEDGSTADVQTSGASISLEGSWLFHELANVQLNNGTVVFTGSIHKYIRNYSPACWFNNITIAKIPNKYIYFSSSSTHDLVIKGNLFITGNNLFRHYSTFNTVLEGTLYNYGRILAYNGAFVFAGTGSSIQSNANSFFNNLIISSGANSLNDDIEIRGDIIFNGGSLDANANEIHIEGDWINNSDNAAFVASTGRVIFEGDDGQSITGDVNFNRFENNISTGYINIMDEVICNQYDWTNGGIRVDHDYDASFTALDLADNGIYGDYILDNGDIELHSLGYINLCGNLTINGGNFEVIGGSTNSQWPGAVDASLTMTGGVLDFKDMGIFINNSAQSLNLNITGGEIKTIGSFYDYRGEFQPSGGEVSLYGQYNAYIGCIPGSSFYNLNIEKESTKGKGSKSSSVSLDKDTEVTNNCVIEEGEFDINGKTINVDELLSIKYGGTLVMTNPADTVNAGTVWWNSGSMANISDGFIFLRQDWVYAYGTLADLSGSNSLILNGSGDQTIKIYEEGASFSTVRIEKTGGNVYTDADYLNDIYIKHHLYIFSQALYFDADKMDVEGSTYVGAGASFIVNNGSSLEIGQNTILGDMQVSNSDVVVNQGFNLVSSGTLSIEDTSSYILEKPYNGSLFNFDGTLELNGGVFEITHNGMEIGPASNIQFNGGNLKIGGNFYAPNNGTFAPAQGTVEFIGSNNGWINMATGNSFYNLVINKNISSYVLFDNEVTIENDLFVQSGELKCESNAFEVKNVTIEPQGVLNPEAGYITISGNWANYHGMDGFIEADTHITFAEYYYSPTSILTDETFNFVTVDKVSPNGNVTLADNTDVTFMQLDINDGKFITGNNNNVIVGNDGHIATNASIIMPDASPASQLTVVGEFSTDNNALFEIGSGNSATVSQFIHDGELTIDGGDFNCNSTFYQGNSSVTNLNIGSINFTKTTPSWLTLNGTLTMTGGTIDAQSNSISFDSNFIGNLTGGTFTTGGSFKAEYDNIFQQNGGEVIFKGDADSTLSLADGCYINDFVFNRTGGTLTLKTDLTVANDFTINSGFFERTNGDLFIGRNWANYAGPSAINLSFGGVTFNSDKPASILTDETFNALIINKSFADGNYLDIPANKNIQVNKHFIAMDGMLRLFNNSFLGVDVHFQLHDGAGIYVDASADTATIKVKMEWANYNTTNNEYSGFFPNTSTVIFDGTSDQQVYGAAFEEKFYNLVIDKPSGEFRPNVNMTVLGDLTIVEGVWSYGTTGLYYDLYGNFTINPNGSWQDDENILYFSSGDDVSFTNNSLSAALFGDINVNLGLNSTNLFVNQGINCQQLSFYKGNIAINNLEIGINNSLHLYDNASLTFENNSVLKMGNNSQVNVSGGQLSFIGTQSENPLLTHEITGFYSFIVENGGTLTANNSVFEFMGEDGVQIQGTGMLGGTEPLKNCIFQNGEPGGTLLKFNNEQDAKLENVTFPTNNWGGLYNVTKENNIGEITFVGSQGDFAGETFENDVNNRINWQLANTRVFIQAHLEGPYENGGMLAQINDILPLSQPYSIAPWNYSGTESVSSIPGNEIVDWVLVELRDATDAVSATESTVVARKAAFILQDGAIVDLDGMSILSFEVPIAQNLYVVVWHRNHLPVMSAYPLQESGGVYHYFFTTSASQAYGGNQVDLGFGDFGMIGGDMNADGTINNIDYNLWSTVVGSKGYLQEDTNLNGQVDNQDKNDIWNLNKGESSTLPE